MDIFEDLGGCTLIGIIIAAVVLLLATCVVIAIVAGVFGLDAVRG